MPYEVLARKWRPQQFEDVVGQDHVTRTLRNAITQKRLANAYLFVGPRGTGKTSLARIFAKALNCATGPTEHPCGKCDACREIAAGNSLDVLEIDGASNNGVDQVRDLRDGVKYTPVNAAYKIYIIDEIHMLSAAAFNALLKTLEEPPPHVKFLFATTEPQKILSTIISRCQRFDLRRIPTAQLVERLELIAKDEGVVVERDALLAIARGADGGMRDAESALDQLIAFCGATITEADVLAVFGLVGRQALDELAAAVFSGDAPETIRRVGELDKAGKDIARLLVDLMELFRNVLIYAHAGESALEVLETQAESARLLSAKIAPDRLLRMVDLLVQAEERMRYALSRRTMLEMTLIRCARMSQTVSIEELVRRVEALAAGVGECADDRPACDTASAEPSVMGAVKTVHPPAVALKPPPKPASAPPLAVPTAQRAAPAVVPAKANVPVAALAVKNAAAPLVAKPAVAPAPAVATGTVPPGRRTMQEWIREPAVHKTLELFNGSITDVS
ncbi:MAG: DNA polymerase III subunit gamma/tau [bacterium]